MQEEAVAGTLFFTALHFTPEIPTAWAGVERGHQGGPGSPGPCAFIESSLRTALCPLSRAPVREMEKSPSLLSRKSHVR